MLCISTVYNRYHYVSDVVAGVVVGLAVFWWGGRVYGDRVAVNEGVKPVSE
jgi:membrane-associated phospholipid phosphatase